MVFYIENKVIRFDKKTLDGKKVVGDNTDYLAQFIFDNEWEGKIKTARFINNDEYVDVILDENDSCYIPIEVMKSGNMNVGVYAGNLTTTTPVKVKITASILEEDGLPADPTPDVYAQLIDMIDKKSAIKYTSFRLEPETGRLYLFVAYEDDVNTFKINEEGRLEVILNG